MGTIATAQLYAETDHRACADRIDSFGPAVDSLAIRFADSPAPARWGPTVTADRWIGRWQRGRASGAVTVDLVPAGEGRTLIAIALDQPRGWWSQPVTTEDAWNVARRVREALEAGSVLRHEPATERAPVAGLALTPRPADPGRASSGILPA